MATPGIVAADAEGGLGQVVGADHHVREHVGVLEGAMGRWRESAGPVERPDLIVATIMAALALTGGLQVFRHAMAELKAAPAAVEQA